MNSNLTVITGGIASGKSRFACEKAKDIDGHRIFIPTALPTLDMKERIQAHQKERGKDFQTMDVQTLYKNSFPKVLKSLSKKNVSVLLMDCLTLWLAYIMEHHTEKHALEQAQILCTTLLELPYPCFVVTDQVGLGGINAQSLSFQRLYGHVQQYFSQHAQEVYMVVMGCSVCLKSHHQEARS